MKDRLLLPLLVPALSALAVGLFAVNISRVFLAGNSEADPMLNDPGAGAYQPLPASPAIDFGAPRTDLPFEGVAPEPGRYELLTQLP